MRLTTFALARSNHSLVSQPEHPADADHLLCRRISHPAHSPSPPRRSLAVSLPPAPPPRRQSTSSQMSTVKTIAVIIAMEAEAAPLVAHLGLKKQDPSPFSGPLPAVVFSGPVGDATVHVCTNGKAASFGVDSVGTVPAALTAYNICATLQPDVLINAGTAGGFKAMGGAIGDVYLATAFKNHDRRIPIPGFDTYGVGATDAAPCPNLRAAMGFKDGVVSTGNSLDAPPVDMENLKARCCER